MKSFIDLLRLIWDIVRTIGPKAMQWFSREQRERERSSRRELRSLEHLVRTLGKLQLWKGFGRSEMIESIQEDLNRILWNIWTEALPYIAIYSRSQEERCLALRNLSQVEGRYSIRCALDTIKGIISNKNTPGRVKQVAKAAVTELKERMEINGNTADENGKAGVLD